MATLCPTHQGWRQALDDARAPHAADVAPVAPRGACSRHSREQGGAAESCLLVPTPEAGLTHMALLQTSDQLTVQRPALMVEGLRVGARWAALQEPESLTRCAAGCGAKHVSLKASAAAHGTGCCTLIRASHRAPVLPRLLLFSVSGDQRRHLQLERAELLLLLLPCGVMWVLLPLLHSPAGEPPGGDGPAVNERPRTAAVAGRSAPLQQRSHSVLLHGDVVSGLQLLSRRKAFSGALAGELAELAGHVISNACD
jgi:hypothetical protein